jgi:hypothetical protein
VFLHARTTAAFQALRRGEPASPSPDREFRTTDLVVVRAGATAPSGEPTVTAQVLTRQGHALVELPARAVGGSYQVELPVRSLALGEYVLRFSAAQGAQSAEITAGFAIVR